MQHKLKKLFDYQRFESDKELTKLIDETQSRYPLELNDSDLEIITAAGEEEILNYVNPSYIK